MTTPVFVSDQDQSTDAAAVTAVVTVQTTGSAALPRPLSSVNDTGRISFGAACRIPEQK